MLWNLLAMPTVIEFTFLRLEWIVEHLNSDVKGEGDIRLFTVSQFAYCTSTSRDI